MKRLLYGCIFLIVVSSVLILLFNKSVRLVESVSMQAEGEEFVLRVYVEERDTGVHIMQSIQYVGMDEITIRHQTPLVSTSLNSNSHQFTGNFVEKKLTQGEIYYQDEIKIKLESKGEHELFVHARFYLGEEEIYLECMEKLIFK